jgi:hypothetical protein
VVRIVSGVPQQEQDTGAVLRGYKNTRAIKLQQEEAQRAQMEHQLRTASLQMKFQEARAEREQLLNQQAQMGDAQALQEMSLRQKLSPSQSMAQDGMKLLESITDPKARALAMPAIKDLIEGQQNQEKQQAFTKEIERAAKDGLIDPEQGTMEIQARVQAGEPMDNILQELSKARMDRATKAAAAEDNAKAFEQAKARIDAAPPGRERRLAQIALKEWEMSPSRQEEEDSGAKLLAGIQEMLVGPLSREDAIAESTKAWGNSKPAPGLPGMTVGQRNAEMEKEPGFFGTGGPDVPAFTGGTRATSKRAPKPAKNAMSLPVASLRKAKDDADVVKILRKAGVPITPENLSAAVEAWQGGE